MQNKTGRVFQHGLLRQSIVTSEADLHGRAQKPGPPGQPPSLLRDRLLRRGEAGDRHAERGAAHVVETDAVAEHDRGRVAAVLAADADLEAGPRLAAAGDTLLHQPADAVLVDRL